MRFPTFAIATACTVYAAFTSTSSTTRATAMTLQSPRNVRILQDDDSKAIGWSPSSWRSKESKQLPIYPDEAALQSAERLLSRSAPLVFAGEIRSLSDQLAQASMGKAFVLFGGDLDCAETFGEFPIDHVRDTFRVTLQMALILTYGGSQPVVKIGRMAGQFAKPRSTPTETIDEVTLPSYQGENINREHPFTKEASEADPKHMIKAFQQCALTLNMLRAFSQGGYANLIRLRHFESNFVDQTPQESRFRVLADKAEESLQFAKACGAHLDGSEFCSLDFFTAHECLLLPYEEAMTRVDSVTGKWYDTSAHLLLVGERTRQPGFARFEFVRGLQNPLGVKISDKASPEDVIELLNMFNPDNVAGRVTLITRMTTEGIREKLPAIIRKVQEERKNVVWVSDPVNGNGFQAEDGFKTKDFDDIREGLEAFFDVHRECGSHPGGIHLEMTGKDVAECLGGDNDGMAMDSERGLVTGCETHSDSRLNAMQSLELAFFVAEKMREANGLGSMD